MEVAINKIFEYFDGIFFEERVEIDQDGYYGTHYQGLCLDTYLENSVLGLDYLSIEDYFETVANVSYCETDSLYMQYAMESIEIRIKVIGAILTLVNESTYNESSKELIIKKSKAFLKRYGLEMEEVSGYLQIKNEYKLFEGSYCDIYIFNEQIYKKRLKSKYHEQENWRKRFKYEYQNMIKLVESPYVLKVFNYDGKEDSYLMEKCDCNIYDFLTKNPFVVDDTILDLIIELLLGMKDVHDAGIIHRDLHLGNILIKEGHIVLSDFGLSKDTMISHSLKSSSSPKNSHYFMDSIGFSDFTKLDKLSDIYSIGRIIDYITGNSELNKKLSYVISKATNRDRNKRYVAIDEFIEDIEIITKEISEENRIERIEIKLSKNIASPEVEEYVTNLAQQERLSGYLVKKQLYNFGKLLVEFDDTNQMTILSEINRNYIKATGYGKFENYDLFATIANYVIRNSQNGKIQKSAYELLEGCAKYRFNAERYLKEVEMYFQTLTS